MRRKLTIFAVVMTGLSLVALGAEKAVDFSGTWDLDASKSELTPTSVRVGSSGGGPGIAGGVPRGSGFPGGGFPGGSGRRGSGLPGGGGGRSGGGYPGGGSRSGGIPGSGGIPRDLDLTLKIEQSDGDMKLTRTRLVNGEERDFAQVYRLDGSESINPVPRGRGEMRTTASWQKNKLVALSTQRISTSGGDSQIQIKEEFSLSKDRRTLTVKTTRSAKRGKTSLRLVYTRE